jgi:Zn-dependent peptidase ImmA (M78 family)
MPKVNPDILKWARETAGLSLDDGAKAIQLNAARGVSGGQRLAALEAGLEEPTRALLSRMAARYRRPLIVFYLRAGPQIGDRGEDFRRVPSEHPPESNPGLDALIRDVRSRHDVVKSLLEDEEVEPLAFVASLRITDGAGAVADSIRKTIGFDLTEFRRARDVNAAFAYLRDRLERSGIFVLLLGNLGSYHSNIESTTFRGYAIADRIAPFIVINDNDAHAAWPFTALHETAHLWLGQTGISGASHEATVERFCNDVAGQLLLPDHELAAISGNRLVSFTDSLETISEFAGQRNVSRRMVAYLLFRSKRIDSARYQELTSRFYRDWLRSKEKDYDKADNKQGPSRYVVLRHRLGPALVGLARRNLELGTLSPVKASRLLGVSPGAVRTFLEAGR